jgi:hypothetical protein
MNHDYLSGTSGPLTSYLRSKEPKKIKTNSIMTTSLPKIKVVREDEDANTVRVKNPVSLDRIDIMSDSGSSVRSIPRVSKPVSRQPPSLPPKQKMSMPTKAFDPAELQQFINNQKHKPVVEKAERDDDDEEEEDEEEDDMDDYGEYGGYDDEDESSVDMPREPSVNNKEQERRKRELLIKLVALENKGVELTKKFSLKSKFEDIEFEYETQKKNLETEAGVKFQQKALMAFVTGVEFLNNKFDPVGAKLDGWSESVMDSINDYDNVFSRLYEKYASRTELAPELELLMTLVASGFMFHLTNSFFKSNMPVMNNIMQNNPDIMKNIAEAMSKSQASAPAVQQRPPEQPSNSMSGPSIDLSSLINTANFNKVGPDPPVSTKEKSVEPDRFSVASSEASEPISTISKSGKKTIKIS